MAVAPLALQRALTQLLEDAFGWRVTFLVIGNDFG